MRNVNPSFIAVLTAFLLGGAPLQSLAERPDSGITGSTIVLHPPGSPPYTFTPGIPWVSEPAAASFTVLRAASGEEVASITTAADGEFALLLRPGRYLLLAEPLEEGCYSPPEPIEVHVKGNRFTPVTISYYWFCFVIPF
ncbi:MAG: hypothetical protein L0Y58_22225 [Verrucomicrobia subdivision 3 bacterium]|nr:hypothetical protein [Limisphaerales bacterium]